MFISQLTTSARNQPMQPTYYIVLHTPGLSTQQPPNVTVLNCVLACASPQADRLLPPWPQQCLLLPQTTGTCSVWGKGHRLNATCMDAYMKDRATACVARMKHVRAFMQHKMACWLAARAAIHACPLQPTNPWRDTRPTLTTAPLLPAAA